MQAGTCSWRQRPEPEPEEAPARDASTLAPVDEEELDEEWDPSYAEPEPDAGSGGDAVVAQSALEYPSCYYCPTCNLSFHSPTQLEDHRLGKAHDKRSRASARGGRSS